jgi:hypothetical protein
MNALRLACCSLLIPLGFVFASCGGNGDKTSGGFGGSTGSNGSNGGSVSGMGGDAGFGPDGLGVGVGAGGGAGTGGDGSAPSYLIYASTDTTMFTLDPTSAKLTLTTVGTYDCIGPSGTPGQQSTAMTDLAVDHQQNIWGLSSYGVRQLTVQGTTVHCGSEIYVHVTDPNSTDPSFPYIKFEALTFAPENTITAGQEVLVAGDTNGQLFAIDTTTNAITQHGQFGNVPANDGHGHNYLYPGGAWELSGDIVFLANDGNPVGFATIRDCPNPPDNTGCNPIDTLAEIDMTAIATAGTQSVLKAIRGQVVKGAGCGDTATGYGSMYGIASWNANVYGFSRSGNLVLISNVDGSACLVQNYPADLFSGAAVTTLAPVKPPPIN